jgi:hypothetical protein
MFTILVVVVAAVMLLVLVLLAVVIIGIKHEPPAKELTSEPPNSISAWLRRLIGVYVRRPRRPSALNEDRLELCPTGRDRFRRQDGLRDEGLLMISLAWEVTIQMQPT